MPDLRVPHPLHGTKRHLPTGIDPLDPEDIGAIVAPRIKFIDETISATTTYTPTRTGMRFIPLFVRAVATNPAGATNYAVRFEIRDTAGSPIASSASSSLSGGESQTLRIDWATNIGGVGGFAWNTVETAGNFLANPGGSNGFDTPDNNVGIGSIAFVETENGNPGSTTVEMVLWEC